MLGRHADHFMLSQMNERVHAITPNAGGRSLQLPDRELAGTATVRVKGGFQSPGPQRTVSSDYAPSGMLPGMGIMAGSDSSMLPGMGNLGNGPGRTGMLPGMGNITSMLPGMGLLSDIGTSLGVGGLAAVGVGIWLLLRK